MGITELIIAFVALTCMEIVLGIDNIVFIAIVSAQLPLKQQPKARRVGLLLAMFMRIGLLFSISFVLQLDNALFHWTDLGIPLSWIEYVSPSKADFSPEQIAKIIDHVNAVSIKDLILLVGGLFLIQSAVREIHKKVAGTDEEERDVQVASFKGVLIRIAIMDIVFSLDSIITAVGMVSAKEDSYWAGIGVMVAAVIVAVVVMMIFAEPVSGFVKKNPTVKMLALSFLMLIGVMLVAEGVGTPIAKGYIYFAMVFALLVEFLNLRVRSDQKGKAKSEPVADAGN